MVGLRRGGGGDILFWTTLPLEGFLLCPWKFQTKQGFILGKSTKLGYSRKKNSRVFQIVVRGGGIRNFCWGDFFTRWRKPEEEWFWQFKPFSKLKTAFCEYWASIKIKIKMTYVSKKYEIKTKMEQEQWIQLKILFLLGYTLKIVV